ncbi:MAG: ABC transporter ATP-binding protein [Bacteroidota bacterium]
MQNNKGTIGNKPDTASQKGKQGKPSIFRVLKPYSRTVAGLIVMALLGSSINLLIPKIIGHAIDAFTAKHFVMETLVIEFLIAAGAIFIFTYLQNIIQTYASERVAKDFRSRLSEKISHQSYTYILRSNPSKLLTNLTSDVDSIKNFVSQAFVIIISSAFVIIGVCVLLITINWRLALAVIAVIPIIAFTFSLIFRRARVLFKKSRENIDALNRIINESIIGSALIRVLNSQQPESSKFMDANIVSRNLGLSILRLFATLIPVIMFVSNLAVVVILSLGGHFVVTDSMSLGDFAAFNSYLMMLIFPLLMIGFMSNMIASASASYARVHDVLESPEPEDTGTISSNIKGDIMLDNVSFSIGEKPILKNISFSVKAGSRTGIIGPTAAGKSQLLYLLANLIHPSSGNIEFDGIPIEKYTRELFHREIGFVFQESVIFNMSLRENIAFNDRVTEESLQKAIETAELSDFIESLPQKLETIVSERGTSLSGGQKQRIMLARALAINPRILLLDDFISRVDNKTENKILCNLERNYPDLTLISVTQKVSSIRNFEQIILLMEGEIIATGTHQQLKEKSSEYNQINNSQRSTRHYEL